ATPHCPVHCVLASIQQTISQEFDRYNFEQLKEYAKQYSK
ncbi:MAG TPA: Rrf2 family transcriptional regulator, partial [Peptococcaceae bacterium]|nr:Rrf2 family transcriptional regulator [Peptococcaceae bacterium]